MKALFRRLQLEKYSEHRAFELHEDPRFFGWDADSARLSDLVDLLHMNIQGSAQRKVRYKPIAGRPEIKRKTTYLHATSVKDMQNTWGAFFG